MARRNPAGIHFHKSASGDRHGYEIWSWALHRGQYPGHRGKFLGLRWFGFLWQHDNGRWGIQLGTNKTMRTYGSRRTAAKALERWKATGEAPKADLTSLVKFLDS